MEAEQEDYKEAGGATAKAAQGTDPELLEELASIKAVVKKAWNAQQNSQQKQKKQGDGKRDANNNPPGKKKNDTCYGCGGTDHFVKDCPNPHKSCLNSKSVGRKARPPCYQQEGNWNFNSGRGHFNRRTTNPRGWARTGLEPVCKSFLHNHHTQTLQKSSFYLQKHVMNVSNSTQYGIKILIKTKRQ